MNDEFSINDEKLTIGKDGVYRWLYNMNMKENRSLLYQLLKIFGAVSLGALVLWFLMLSMKGARINFPKTIGFWLLITAGVELLVWLGFSISRKAMKDTYPLRFEMDEKRISIYQSEGNLERRKSAYPGRKFFQDAVSETPFSAVLKITVRREWDLIDMVVIGGGFQVYARQEDFDEVLGFILAHVPERVRPKAVP